MALEDVAAAAVLLRSSAREVGAGIALVVGLSALMVSAPVADAECGPETAVSISPVYSAAAAED